MVVVNKGTKIKDKSGEEYILTFDARVEAREYLNDRLIFQLGDNSYTCGYRHIEFKVDDGKYNGKINVENR